MSGYRGRPWVPKFWFVCTKLMCSHTVKRGHYTNACRGCPKCGAKMVRKNEVEIGT